MQTRSERPAAWSMTIGHDVDDHDDHDYDDDDDDPPTLWCSSKVGAKHRLTATWRVGRGRSQIRNIIIIKIMIKKISILQASKKNLLFFRKVTYKLTTI